MQIVRRGQMMRYYSWDPADDETNTSIAKIQVEGLYEDEHEVYWRFILNFDPLAAHEWDRRAVAYWNEEDGPLTDLPFSVVHVHSPTLKALLEKLDLARDIQYWPIQMRSLQTDKIVGTYYIPYFLRWIDCLDEERTWLWISVLRRAAIGEARLFRVVHEEHLVVIREDVREAIVAAGITGCKFVQLEVI
jgi:hypothetical protein